MNGGALHQHTELRDYDNQNRLLSRSLPGTTGGVYYEVYYYTQSGSNRTVKKALSTDATWHPGDASQTIIATGYEQDEFWQSYQTVTHPGDAGLESYQIQALGGFSAAPESTALGTWELTGVTASYVGGATTMEKTFRLPGSPLTRTRRYVDGALRLTVTSCNGLPLLYDTNGTTYSSKVAAFSPLREPLSYADPASGYWASREIDPATGMAYINYLPSGTYQNYSWIYFGDDVRAGLVNYSYDYATGAWTLSDHNARGQRIRVWGGESPSQTTYDDLGRMKFLSTYRGGSDWTSWTWPTGSTGSTGPADTTEWTYPPTLALPLSKIYPDAGGQAAARRTVGYTYRQNGSLATRTWQRMPWSFSNTAAGAGVVTTYLYDAFARLQTIDYPAATTTVAHTPDVGFTYDGAGRIATRTEAGQATTTYLYQPWGAAWKETITSLSGEFPSSVVERTYDASSRPDLLTVNVGGVAQPNLDYNFDPATGLLADVASDGRTITYGYNGIGSAPTALNYAHGGSTLLSTARPLNADGLVSGITHSQSSTHFQSMTYDYSVDQVTRVTRGPEEDNMSWDYRYDNRRQPEQPVAAETDRLLRRPRRGEGAGRRRLNQLTSADKRFPNGEFAAGLQTEYGYDMAGNRTSKAQGGSATFTEGTGVRTTNYGTANPLNQYTAVTNPSSSGTRWADVSGRRSSSSETIQVNGVTAGYQQNPTTGRHFRREVPLTAADTNNTNYAYLYTTSTIGGSTTDIDAGYNYLPPPTETLTYDADGNLLSDGRWIYSWDAENRLAGLLSVETYVEYGVAWNRWTFKYDGLSRRILSVKENYNWDIGDFAMESRKATIYDAWNLVHEQQEDYYLYVDYELYDWYLIHVDFNSKNFVWGPDIGSATHGHTSWQKAGGVGGLLYHNSLGWSGSQKQFPLMDRLGNVTGYRRAVSGSPAALDAVYEYDAFGREVRSTGPASGLMPFRFSTKYTDGETGLVYYGYRFFDPDRGRWINRDPIGESGGLNLYNILNNRTMWTVDYLGLEDPLHVNSLMDDFDLDPFSGINRVISALNNKTGKDEKKCFEAKIWNLDEKSRNGKPPTRTAEPASIQDFKTAIVECDIVYVVGHGNKNADSKGSHIQLRDGRIDSAQGSIDAARHYHACKLYGCYNNPDHNAESPISYLGAVSPQALSVDQALQDELSKYSKWDNC